ncbi:PGF-CTERM-anchored ABC transporter substrate-binding protein [Natronomonas sp. EA1]|uniref:PGF-CTERM-anchored ABC transporter substrate-binding protein n=1 Tax=Natronomonas sp. EA1 TaxID=3421655 RepID=UPI003EC0496A
MRQTLIALLVVLAAVPVGTGAVAAAPATQENCGFPYSATDATGTEVTLEEEPQDIVVLGHSTAQVMWELDAKEKVVGMPVDSYSAYLEGSSEKTNVFNSDFTVNQEQVVALEPDLVIAPNITPDSTVEDLRANGITVFKINFSDSLSAIYEKTTQVGRLTGECAAAEETNAEMREQVELIRTTVEGEDRPRVLYYFFNYTAGKGTFINDVIETAGGESVAANAGISGYKVINDEVVAERNPQWLVKPSGATFPAREPYTSTIAMQQNQTVTVDRNLISQPAPRVVQPMTKLVKAFHPEAYAEAKAELESTPTPTPTPEPTDEPTPEPTPTAGDGAGFGVPAAVVAAGAALLARRARA